MDIKSKVSVYVKCPYYHREEKQKIFCEGIQEGTSIHLAFDTGENLKEYERRFCKRCWGDCILAQMQNRKYGYEM